MFQLALIRSQIIESVLCLQCFKGIKLLFPMISRVVCLIRHGIPKHTQDLFICLVAAWCHSAVRSRAFLVWRHPQDNRFELFLFCAYHCFCFLSFLPAMLLCLQIQVFLPPENKYQGMFCSFVSQTQFVPLCWAWDSVAVCGLSRFPICKPPALSCVKLAGLLLATHQCLPFPVDGTHCQCAYPLSYSRLC